MKIRWRDNAVLNPFSASVNSFFLLFLIGIKLKALQHIQRRAITLKIDAWVKCEVDERKITLQTDEAKLRELSLLDGCYCLTTNVSAAEMDKESVHARYKDLATEHEKMKHV